MEYALHKSVTSIDCSLYNASKNPVPQINSIVLDPLLHLRAILFLPVSLKLGLNIFTNSCPHKISFIFLDLLSLLFLAQAS